MDFKTRFWMKRAFFLLLLLTCVVFIAMAANRAVAEQD